MKRIPILVLVVLISLLSSCSVDVETDKISKGVIKVNSSSDLLADTAIFSSLKADIYSNTEYLGLKNGSGSSRDIEENEIENYGGELVSKESGDENPSIITFTVEVENPENVDNNGVVRKKGETLEQNEIPGYIDKTYVLGDYTIISLLRIDLDTLLNAENTQCVESDGMKSYSGSFDFSGEKDGELRTFDFRYREGDDFFLVDYSAVDPQTKEPFNVSEEKMYFRSERNTSKLTKEDIGVCEFDTYGFENSVLRCNYLINNTTGMIYEIPDGYELSVHKGVLYDRTQGPLNIAESENGEISLNQIILNSSLAIGDFFKDKYNQYYVLNDAVDALDNSNPNFSVMYYTVLNEYVPLSDGTVIKIGFNSDTSYYGTNAIESVSRVGKGFAEEKIEVDLDISYSSLNNLSIEDYFVEYNSLHGQKYVVDYAYGSSHFFDRIEDGYLYSYFCSQDFIAVFARTSLSTYDMTIREYFSKTKRDYFALLDAETLVIASNEYTGNRNYSLYLVKPFENKEYKEHYFDYILKSSGKLVQTPTYDEFRKKYYSAFRQANTDRYTPDEIREKYQIDTEGTAAWVEGWQNIEGLTFEESGIDSETLNTVYYYYQWKGGYSAEDFDNMYYKYIYKEDGVVKSDLTQHVLLENVQVSASEWKNADIYSLELKSKSYNSNSSYYLVKDTVTGEYKAEESSKVILERQSQILQPINRI